MRWCPALLNGWAATYLLSVTPGSDAGILDSIKEATSGTIIKSIVNDGSVTADAYQNSPSEDLFSNIGIDIYEAGLGDQCKAGDWTTVHWSAYLKDGRAVSNSQDEGNGLPKEFILGKGEVFKCLNLALQTLKKGSKAKLSCPAQYVWGNKYTHSTLGGEPIPINSDIDLDVEVLDCNRRPDAPSLAWTAPCKFDSIMKPDNCFYLFDAHALIKGPRFLKCKETRCGLENKPYQQQFFLEEGSESIHYIDNDGGKRYLYLVDLAEGRFSISSDPAAASRFRIPEDDNILHVVMGDQMMETDYHVESCHYDGGM